APNDGGRAKLIVFERATARGAGQTEGSLVMQLDHAIAASVRLHAKNKAMSALGQKRTSRPVEAMSALPPKADIGPISRSITSSARPSSEGLSLVTSIVDNSP